MMGYDTVMCLLNQRQRVPVFFPPSGIEDREVLGATSVGVQGLFLLPNNRKAPMPNNRKAPNYRALLLAASEVLVVE